MSSDPEEWLIIEAAKSSRSRCSGCEQKIARGELRFGSAEHGWYHVVCAARTRPEVLADALEVTGDEALKRDASLRREMTEARERGYSDYYPHAERAPSGRARCLECRLLIATDSLRVVVPRDVEGYGGWERVPGYLHLACAARYLGFDARPIILDYSRQQKTVSDQAALKVALDEAFAGTAASPAAIERWHARRKGALPRAPADWRQQLPASSSPASRAILVHVDGNVGDVMAGSAYALAAGHVWQRAWPASHPAWLNEYGGLTGDDPATRIVGFYLGPAQSAAQRQTEIAAVLEIVCAVSITKGLPFVVVLSQERVGHIARGELALLGDTFDSWRRALADEASRERDAPPP